MQPKTVRKETRKRLFKQLLWRMTVFPCCYGVRQWRFWDTVCIILH